MNSKPPISVPTESRPTAHEFLFDYMQRNTFRANGGHVTSDHQRDLVKFAEAYAASSSLLPVGRPCSACKGNHFDHTFVHFSLSDDLAGFCWEEDHYPNEGDILVSSNISEVTCPKCREYCQTLNQLKKSEGFSEDDIRRDDLPRDAFELIHDLAYDHEGRDRWQYRTRAQQILKSNGLPVGRQHNWKCVAPENGYYRWECQNPGCSETAPYPSDTSPNSSCPSSLLPVTEKPDLCCALVADCDCSKCRVASLPVGESTRERYFCPNCECVECKHGD